MSEWWLNWSIIPFGSPRRNDVVCRFDLLFLPVQSWDFVHEIGLQAALVRSMAITD